MTSSVSLSGKTRRFLVSHHLRHMTNMIIKLKEVSHPLTDEQQIQSVIRSLPNSWEYMKIQMTHFGGLNTFEHVGTHVELEEDRLKAIGSKVEGHMESSFGPKKTHRM